MCASDWGLLKNLVSIVAGVIVAAICDYFGLAPLQSIIYGGVAAVVCEIIGYVLEDSRGELHKGFRFKKKFSW